MVPIDTAAVLVSVAVTSVVLVANIVDVEVRVIATGITVVRVAVLVGTSWTDNVVCVVVEVPVLVSVAPVEKVVRVLVEVTSA